MESQIESAESRRQQSSAPKFTPDQVARLRERESLQLSKTRVLHDLGTATNQRYRESLEAALLHLEQKLAALDE